MSDSHVSSPTPQPELKENTSDPRILDPVIRDCEVKKDDKELENKKEDEDDQSRKRDRAEDLTPEAETGEEKLETKKQKKEENSTAIEAKKLEPPTLDKTDPLEITSDPDTRTNDKATDKPFQFPTGFSSTKSTSQSSKSSFFGSSLSSSGSNLGLRPSVFGSFKSTTSSDSSSPKPFSSFSYSNPFLNMTSQGKSKEADDADDKKKGDQDDNNKADNNNDGGEVEGSNETFEQPYVQLDKPLEEKRVETGEEMETSIFSCRAKLYSVDPTSTQEGWKERGIGVLHLNVLKNSDSEKSSSVDDSASSSNGSGSKSRIVMRSDGLLRVILNIRLVKGVEVLAGMKSSLSSEKFVRIAAWKNGKPIQYALRMQNENVAKEFITQVKSVL
ncbi:hypothetical protein V1511DRAFT_71797 [Dipodascopsis uninucleata]